MTARLATEIWVSAYLMRLGAEGIPAFIAHKGDRVAGAVAVKIAFMNGKASLYTRHYDFTGHLKWDGLLEQVEEAAVDAAIARRLRGDRDLWVVEVEDPQGRHLLDTPGLEE
ncbi:MAG: DUF1491 family protein [Pikeienuella sp.]